ncbi:unnamed protein product [Heterobilharzia americana]|nr:unnamed protein product [Heterobilharzia americana]
MTLNEHETKRFRIPSSNLISNQGSLCRCGRFIWTSVNEGHGYLNYIAPQTRLRVVDNSRWSSIQPSTIPGRDQSGKKIAASEQKAPNVVKGDKDVRDLIALGSKALSIKPAKCICVYNKKNRGKIGDKVLVAVEGELKKGWIVGSRLPSKDGWPRFEANNVVLIDDDGNPLGTRILVPIPARLRSLSGDITKILSIASSFV